MKYELSQEFYFDAAHTLERTVDKEASKRIHGHTYHARITILGIPDPLTGMIVDLANLKNAITNIREALDHRLLDDISELESATLENLCTYLWLQFEALSIVPEEILVERKASGDRCILRKNQ